MDMIPRILVNTIKKGLKSGFANLIYGPRRIGKTVLLQQLVSTFGKPGLWLNGDHQEDREILSHTSPIILKKLVSRHDLIFIDEAQRITNIGLSLKILIDNFPNKKIFVTGSSSLSLARGIQESLTGRTIRYRLFPFSTKELTTNLQGYQKNTLLEEQLIYGGYPYLQQLNNHKDKKDYLKSIIEDYLYKDVLELKDVSSPDNLRKLTVLLAFQIGSEVSLNELANNLKIDVKTVNRYLSLLKQSFVIFELGAFSRNLRKEIAKSKKYYFWDLGIRNALIDQFFPLDVRRDIGQLWENFLAIERLKKHEYQRCLKQYYFWRTYEQAEIDWIESEGNNLCAYEFKWNKSKTHTPKLFKDNYQAQAKQISKDNYLNFIL